MTLHADANQSFFDKNAHQYDARPMAIILADAACEAFLDAVEFDEEETTVLDFACGTGLISQGLAPYCKQIVGVDISQGMVDYYNQRVTNQGIPAEEMQAIRVGLKGKPGELDDRKFDVVVCAQSFHHFTSISDTALILQHFIKPGTGSLLVVDLVRNEDSSSHPHAHAHAHEHEHDHSHVVAHKGGFTEAEMKNAFEVAGLEDFEWEVIGEFDPVRGNKGRKLELFIASGTRPWKEDV